MIKLTEFHKDELVSCKSALEVGFGEDQHVLLGCDFVSKHWTQKGQRGE